MGKIFSIITAFAMAVTTVTVHNGTGKQYDDGMKGTYHVQIGADRGLVKSYSFEKLYPTHKKYMNYELIFKQYIKKIMPPKIYSEIAIL